MTREKSWKCDTTPLAARAVVLAAAEWSQAPLVDSVGVVEGYWAWTCALLETPPGPAVRSAAARSGGVAPVAGAFRRRSGGEVFPNLCGPARACDPEGRRSMSRPRTGNGSTARFRLLVGGGCPAFAGSLRRGTTVVDGAIKFCAPAARRGAPLWLPPPAHCRPSACATRLPG